MQDLPNNNNSPFANADNFRAHLDKIKTEAVKAEIKPEVKRDTHEEKTIVPDQTESDADIKTDNDDDALPVSEANEKSEKVKEPRLIPKSRLKEESDKRKVAEENLMKEREERIRYETELKMLREMNDKPQTPAPKEPELEAFDALDQDAHQIYSKKIRDLENKVQEISSKTSQQTQALHIENTVKAQRDEFEKENPDFRKAFDYYTNLELKTAKRFIKNEKDAQIAVANNIAMKIKNAYDNKENVAELFYGLAQDYGYSNDKAANSRNDETESHDKEVVDLDAVKRNKEKSASMGNIKSNVNLGKPGNVLDFKQCLRDPKNPSSGVDPEKFRLYRERMSKNAR